MCAFESLDLKEILARLTGRGVSSVILNIIDTIEKNFASEVGFSPLKSKKGKQPLRSSPLPNPKIWDTLMSFSRSGDLMTIPRKGAKTCKTLLYLMSFQSCTFEDRIGKLLSYVFVKCGDDNRVSVVHTDESLLELDKWIALLKNIYRPYENKLPHERKDLVIARHHENSPYVDSYELIP